MIFEKQVSEYANAIVILGNWLIVSYKLEIVCRYSQKRNDNIHIKAYSIFIHKSQKLEITSMSLK